MHESKNMLHLLTMLEAIEKVFWYASNYDDDESFYWADKQMPFSATVNLLIAIGEESKKLSNGLKATAVLDWRVVSAMRDKIAHNYRGVDPVVVWNTVRRSLPPLKEVLIGLIPLVEDHAIFIKEALKSRFYEDLNYLSRFVPGMEK